MINLKRLVRVLGDQSLATMRVASEILREPWVDDGVNYRGRVLVAREKRRQRVYAGRGLVSQVDYKSGIMCTGEIPWR